MSLTARSTLAQLPRVLGYALLCGQVAVLALPGLPGPDSLLVLAVATAAALALHRLRTASGAALAPLVLLAAVGSLTGAALARAACPPRAPAPALADHGADLPVLQASSRATPLAAPLARPCAPPPAPPNRCAPANRLNSAL